MELSLPGTNQGCVCRQVAGGQGGPQAGAVRRWESARKHFCPVFIERDQKTPSEHVLPSAQIKLRISSFTTGSVLWKPTFE